MCAMYMTYITFMMCVRRKLFTNVAFLDLPSKKRNVQGTSQLVDPPFTFG